MTNNYSDNYSPKMTKNKGKLIVKIPQKIQAN